MPAGRSQPQAHTRAFRQDRPERRGAPRARGRPWSTGLVDTVATLSVRYLSGRAAAGNRRRRYTRSVTRSATDAPFASRRVVQITIPNTAEWFTRYSLSCTVGVNQAPDHFTTIPTWGRQNGLLPADHRMQEHRRCLAEPSSPRKLNCAEKPLMS